MAAPPGAGALGAPAGGAPGVSGAGAVDWAGAGMAAGAGGVFGASLFFSHPATSTLAPSRQNMTKASFFMGSILLSRVNNRY